MSEITPNLNYLWASLIIDELARSGVECICLSPGSRCTPLTVAVANHPNIESVVHFDERGASFFALGHARATGKPVALISTSGTAVANYFPAVIEAAMDNTPLIILTADRPPELRSCGANQTIDQVKIFGDYVRWYSEIPCPSIAISPEFVLSTIDQAVRHCLRSPAGPVHLNCMYREPLLPESFKKIAISECNSYIGSALERTFTNTTVGDAYRSNITRWLDNDRVYTRSVRSQCLLTRDENSTLKETINSTRDGLLVVGRLRREQDRKAVRRFAKSIGWPVFTDITSGIKLGYDGGNMIHYYDQLVSMRDFDEVFSPSVVLQIGERLTSKTLSAYLQRIEPEEFIQVKDHPVRIDPGHRQASLIECDIAWICDELEKNLTETCESKHITCLTDLSEKIEDRLDQILEQSDEITEPSVARQISKLIPESHGLFLASSMPIRDMNSYAVSNGACVTLGTNRGASGIDGTIANACGLAQAIGAPVTLLIGDLAFLHDLNSLALIGETGVVLIIVIINNDGGGIFSALPIAKVESVFEKYFGTPHGLGFRSAAEMFGVDYANPATLDEFVRVYKSNVVAGRASIIEVRTDRQRNDELRQRLSTPKLDQ